MSRNTITQAGTPRTYERIGAAAVTPGMLLELTSANKFQAHSTAGGACAALVAVEQDDIGDDVTTAYSLGDTVRAGLFSPGDEAYLLLANGENAAYGSLLESNGDGYVRVVDTDTSAGTIVVGSIKFMALEALDMSGSSGVDPSSQLIRCVAI